MKVSLIQDLHDIRDELDKILTWEKDLTPAHRVIITDVCNQIEISASKLIKAKMGFIKITK